MKRINKKRACLMCKTYGVLTIEHSFINFEEIPVLFVAQSQAKNHYLCLCSDIRDVQRHLIVPVSARDVYAMVMNKMPIYNIFVNAKKVLVMEWHDIVLTERLVACESVSEWDLPEKDAYLRCLSAEDYNFAHSIVKMDTFMKRVHVQPAPLSIGNKKALQTGVLRKKSYVTVRRADTIHSHDTRNP